MKIYFFLIFLLISTFSHAQFSTFSDFAPNHANQIFTDPDFFPSPLGASDVSVQLALQTLANNSGSGASELTGLSDVNSSTQGSGRLLISDGSNFNSVVMGGGATIDSNGSVTVASGSFDGEYLRLDTSNDPLTGTLEISNNLTIGSGSAGVDYTLTFDGETNDGVITWMEDENRFDFASHIQVDETLTFDAEFDNGNSGTSDIIDWGVGNKQKSTLTGNVTFTFTDPPGPCNLTLKLIQDATGSRSVTFPATVKWQRGFAPDFSNSAASSTDIVTFYHDGTNYYASVGYAFN